MNPVSSFVVLLGCAALLHGCSPAPAPGSDDTPTTPDTVTEAAALPLPDEASAAVLPTTFNTANSVRDIMNLMVETNARQLWNAVSYVATADGVEETLPETDADWQRLRANAVALIEAGNALMLPGRQIDVPENLGDYEAFMHTPDEIAGLINADPESWAYNLQEMQAATLLTLAAIDERDLLRFTEQAATINQACESCHAQYWYRPLPMQGAEGLR